MGLQIVMILIILCPSLFPVIAMKPAFSPDKPRLAVETAAPLARPVPMAAQDLFQGGSVVAIEHKGELYQLRLTRNDKLILTK